MARLARAVTLNPRQEQGLRVAEPGPHRRRQKDQDGELHKSDICAQRHEQPRGAGTQLETSTERVIQLRLLSAVHARLYRYRAALPEFRVRFGGDGLFNGLTG